MPVAMILAAGCGVRVSAGRVKQVARKRGAPAHAQRERHNETASLCNCEGAAATPAPHAMGVRTLIRGHAFVGCIGA